MFLYFATFWPYHFTPSLVVIVQPMPQAFFFTGFRRRLPDRIVRRRLIGISPCISSGMEMLITPSMPGIQLPSQSSPPQVGQDQKCLWRVRGTRRQSGQIRRISRICLRPVFVTRFPPSSSYKTPAGTTSWHRWCTVPSICPGTLPGLPFPRNQGNSARLCDCFGAASPRAPGQSLPSLSTSAICNRRHRAHHTFFAPWDRKDSADGSRLAFWQSRSWLSGLDFGEFYIPVGEIEKFHSEPVILGFVTLDLDYFLTVVIVAD